ncbi:MAG: hypothetical protein JXK07_06055 [Spirochaetes bacterium]|nr:hypothetical protein [Spirochaetota bacterium]MBN2771441.1 hypothetical protein [Spirochaetota bacterium]
MKTIDHLINKNVYYLGNNYEYFKHISRFFALQRCKSIFISNKKEAITSIDRELGNMRATSYAHYVQFNDTEKYIKNLTRILKNGDTPDYLIISFKPEFENFEEGSMPLLNSDKDSIEEIINFYVTNTVLTVKYFLELMVAQGKGKIINITTDTSTNPLERTLFSYLDSHILAVGEDLKSNGYSQIDCKVMHKRASAISYDRFVQKLSNALISSKNIIRL